MPGQAVERLDQLRDGLDEQGGHAGRVGQRPRRPPRPPSDCIAPIFCSASRREASSASLTAAVDEVLEHLDVVGVDGRRVDRDRDERLLAGHDGADDAAAGRALDLGLGQLGLDALHLLLHLHAPCAAGCPCPSIAPRQVRLSLRMRGRARASAPVSRPRPGRRPPRRRSAAPRRGSRRPPRRSAARARRRCWSRRSGRRPTGRGPAEMFSSRIGRRRSATSRRNALSSGKPRVTTPSSTLIGPAGDDQRLRRRVGADPRDDLRPAVAEDREVAGRGGRARPAARGRRGGAASAAAASAARRRVGVGAVGFGRGRLGRRGLGGAAASLAGASGGAARSRRPPRAPARLGGAAAAAPASARRASGAGGSAGAVGGAARRGAGARRRRRRATAGRGAGAAAGSGNRASSSWRRRPPTPARLGSIAARRRAAAASSATACVDRAVAARAVGSAPTIPARSASITWSRKPRRSRPRSSSAVEQPDARPARRRDEGVDEAVDRLGVGEAEQVADAGLVEPVGRRRQQLVEHRLGVAHAAGGEPGDEVDRLGRRPSGRRPRGSAGACPRSRRSSGAGRRTAGGATGSPAGTPGGGSRRT